MRLHILLATAVVLLGSLASATAATIPASTYPAIGNGNGNGTATVFNLNSSLGLINAGKTFTSIGPIDFSFPVSGSGSTTYIVSEGITNNTNQTWTDFHEQLGTGVSGQFALGSIVTILNPPDGTFTNSAFGNLSINGAGSEIDYTGGSVLPGNAFNVTFSIIVPSGLDGPYNFTLRQTPSVPEPASLVLFALGAIGTVLSRRRLSW